MVRLIDRIKYILIYIVLFTPLIAMGGPSWEVQSSGVVNQGSGVLVTVVKTLSRFAKGTELTFSGGGLLVLTVDAVEGAITLTGDLKNKGITNGEIGSSIDASLNTSITFWSVPELNGGIPASGDKVGAFVGDVLRGEKTVVIYNGKSYCVITVRVKVGDTVSFKLFDSNLKRTLDGGETTTINSSQMAAQEIGDPTF